MSFTSEHDDSVKGEWDMYRRLVVFSILTFLLLLLIIFLFAAPAVAQTVFVNEIHYDNVKADTGEAIGIAGPTGTDLTGWSIVLYNGANGAGYDTDSLSGTIPDQQNGFGVTVSPDPAQDLFLHSAGGLFLDTHAPTTATTIKFRNSENVRFAGGNSWQEIGTWNVSLP